MATRRSGRIPQQLAQATSINNAAAPRDPTTHAGWMRLSKAQLIKACSDRGLATNGSKKNLADRILPPAQAFAPAQALPPAPSPAPAPPQIPEQAPALPAQASARPQTPQLANNSANAPDERNTLGADANVKKEEAEDDDEKSSNLGSGVSNRTIKSIKPDPENVVETDASSDEDPTAEEEENNARRARRDAVSLVYEPRLREVRQMRDHTRAVLYMARQALNLAQATYRLAAAEYDDAEELVTDIYEQFDVARQRANAIRR